MKPEQLDEPYHKGDLLLSLDGTMIYRVREVGEKIGLDIHVGGLAKAFENHGQFSRESLEKFQVFRPIPRVGSDLIEAITKTDSWTTKLRLLKRLGAAMVSTAVCKNDDTPVAAAIFVQGEPETKEIMDAIKAVEENWHK